MTASEHEKPSLHRQLDVLIEDQIQELRVLGLSLDFASGLQEVADNTETDSARLLMMGSLKLLLEARNTRPMPHTPIRLLHATESLASSPSAAQVGESSQESDGLNSSARAFMKRLMGDRDVPKDFLQQDVVALVERLILRDTQRRKSGRPTPPLFYDALRLSMRGYSDDDAALEVRLTANNFRSIRLSFVKRVQTKGHVEEEMALLRQETELTATSSKPKK
jgi:hypothetical protein